MKYIEELRNGEKTKGKTIWIIGTGPSLDKYPDDFFDNKISIGLSFAFIAFPKCTYTMAVHNAEPKLMKEKYPRFLKKSIFLLAPKDNIKLFGLIDPKNYSDEPYYMRWTGDMDHSTEDFQNTVDDILSGKSTKYVQKGTVLHFAIQAAAVMGAKKIILAGCDMKTSLYHWYAQGRGLSKFYYPTRRPGSEFPLAYQQGKIKDFRLYHRGLILLKKMFETKMKIVKYEYSKGEIQITEKMEEIKLQIGGALKPFLTHQGFEILDFPYTAGATYEHDLTKPLPFEDNTVKEIVAFHSLERLSPHEVVPFLWECYRVLKPAAQFLITVTDFNWLIINFLENGGVLSETILGRLYGDSWIREFTHRNCFSLPNLLKAIKAAGFKKFKLLRLEELKDIFPEEEENIAEIYQVGDIILKVFKDGIKVKK